MRRFLLYVALIPILFVSSCQKDGSSTGPITPPAGPKISTGTFIDAGTQSIATTGGTFAIARPGEAIDGFSLTVPQGSFPQSQSFGVSYAEIKSHQFGNLFTPVSPLIRIASDAGLAAHEMVLKIPIKLSTNYFAMAFFYDAAAGTLEPLSALLMDSVSITVTTRHLSPTNSRVTKRLFRDGQTVGEIVVGAVLQTALDASGMVTTGFTPGVDDWEFPNYGSYIAPPGHCAGQSAVAIWYYYEKKTKGEPGLFGRYDRIHPGLDPDVLWQDNPRGYRLASAIQDDMNFKNWEYWTSADSWIASVVWNEFLYSMLITGKPQLVVIRASKTGEGHALVVYKIDPTAHLLYVADPNYPANLQPGTGHVTLRTMEYVPGLLTGSFKTYTSAMSAGDPNEILFDQIGYAAVTSHIDWAQIGRRWAELEAGSVGTELFPEYTLYQYETGTRVPFQDSMVTTFDAITVACESDECAGHIPGTTNRQEIEAFDPVVGMLVGKGDAITLGRLRIPLAVGSNEVGLCFYGQTATSLRRYVDFRWIHIFRRVSLVIGTTETDQAPVATAGITGKNYTFVAKSGGRAPLSTSIKYVWNFGDGTPPVTVFNDSAVIQRFSNEGTFTVSVTMSDGPVIVGTGQASVTIGSALALIKKARIDLMNVGYYRTCTDSGRKHIESWAYETTNGSFTGWTFNSTWLDTTYGGYPQVPVPFTTTMKVCLTLNTIGALCVVDSFRVVRVYDEPWGCTLTEVLTGQKIPWDSGHPENGYMNYILSGATLPTNITFSWVEQCQGSPCVDRIYQYDLTGSRLDVHFY